MNRHTKEPWGLNRHGAIIGGPVIEFTNGSAQSQLAMATMANWMEEGDAYENARRIVVCVNACEGFDTDDLERQNEDGKKILQFIQELSEQRDQLLTALKDAAYWVRYYAPNPDMNGAVSRAEKAISSAESTS